MKIVKAVLAAGLAVFMICEFFGEELSNAAGFKSALQHEVLADQEVTKDEALLLVVDHLKRGGKQEAGATFVVENNREYICRASWVEDGTAASGAEELTYSVNRMTGTVKLLEIK
ncbi:hypothetical protein GKZ89_15490 [Bacillus mangrovi]|uniref:PepSY domain-containing protein n=1 Tax=Metabacillus mangrovi TaxID=1491830 RepID=A0A7X2S7W0_9BACI|nr:hypothetical protein [Metabacillus mangrovi]MTH54806.1 hypothetical protein [Metabacillus mangrovi]